MAYYQMTEKKIKTAVKLAALEGVLIMDSLSEMKSISAESKAGYKRIQEILEPTSKQFKHVIGFYRITDGFSQLMMDSFGKFHEKPTFSVAQVEEWIREDLIHAKLY